MKSAFVMLFLVGTQLCLGQNLFDGTWLNKLGEQVPQGTVSYSLDKDTFRCSCAVSNIEIKPDGEDHKVPETPYWGTLNVQAVDTHTVVILAKKSGRITYTEIDSVTDDMLTQVVKDTTSWKR